MKDIGYSFLLVWKTAFGYCLLLCAVVLSSCEKVIDLKLDEADKKVVIEGTVAFGDRVQGGTQEVRISETRAFDEDNASDNDTDFNGLSGAVVTVRVNGDSVHSFYEAYPGVYRSIFKGVPGDTYELTVALDGKTYTAISAMPKQVVTLDSLWVEKFGFGDQASFFVYPKYNDPKGLGNYYNLVEYANDTLVRKAFPQNDEFSDGNTITRPLIYPDSKIEKGDKVTVYLQCVDADVYEYWFSLDAASTGNNQSAAPTNPVTNISGGALGYFSAYSETSYSIYIP